MGKKKLLEQVFPLVGREENVKRVEVRSGSLMLSVKDRSVVDLDSLRKIEEVLEVKLTNSWLKIKAEGLESEEEAIMAKKDYSELVSKAISLVGGKENIDEFTHCITRLRFNVKNKDAVQADEIKKIKGLVGCNWAGNQFQIIIGQDVADVYDMICKESGFSAKAAVAAEEKDAPKEKKTVKTFLSDGLRHFIACVMPVIPVMTGTGMIKCVLVLLNMAGILTADSSTYQLFYFVSDAGLYFLPVYVGVLTAKHFGGTQVMGALMGAMLLHPSFVNAEVPFSLFGIGVPAVSYASSLVPAFLIVLVMCYVEKFFTKHCPKAVRSLLPPMLTVIVMVPLGFVVLGPLGNEVGEFVGKFLLWLNDTFGFVAVALVAALYPVMVITGMHYSLVPPMMQALAAGADYLVCQAMLCSNVSQGIASLAVGIKSKKDPEIRSTGFSAAVTALLGGITEPSLYGITLRFKTPLIAAMIGNAVGGAIMGINGVYKPIPGGGGTIYGMLPTYVTEDPGNFLWATVGIVATIVVTFVVTLILYKEPEGGEAR